MLLSTVSCHSQSETKYKSYGRVFNSEVITPLSEALESLGEADTSRVTLEATVAQVCQVKGCWITLKAPGDHTVRVTFKDYGFFLPKDIAGRKVLISGLATTQALSKEAARHYAEDAELVFNPDKEAEEVSIVADGVLVALED